MATDYYELLGVDRSASEDELKRAYRQLANELHPDKNGGDPESEARFKEVSVAYETLRDPERRRRYDMFGPNGDGGQQPMGDVFGGGFGDLFESFFGGQRFGGGRASGPRRGEDVEIAVELEFEEAVFGVSRSVEFRGLVTCPDCSGSGAAPGTSVHVCPDCGGQGQVRRVRQSILGQVVTSSPCPRCRGEGEIVESPCPVCRGEGRRAEERSVVVEVPPGVDDGSTLRVRGAGAPRRCAAGCPATSTCTCASRATSGSNAPAPTSSRRSTCRSPRRRSAESWNSRPSTAPRRSPFPPVPRPARSSGCAATACRTCGVAAVATCTCRSSSTRPSELTKEQEQLLRELASDARRGGRAGGGRLLLPDPLRPFVSAAGHGDVAPERPDRTLRDAAALIFVEDPLDPRPNDEDLHHLRDVLRLAPGERGHLRRRSMARGGPARRHVGVAARRRRGDGAAGSSAEARLALLVAGRTRSSPRSRTAAAPCGRVPVAERGPHRVDGAKAHRARHRRHHPAHHRAHRRAARRGDGAAARRALAPCRARGGVAVAPGLSARGRRSAAASVRLPPGSSIGPCSPNRAAPLPAGGDDRPRRTGGRLGAPTSSLRRRGCGSVSVPACCAPRPRRSSPGCCSCARRSGAASARCAVRRVPQRQTCASVRFAGRGRRPESSDR